MRDKSWRVWRSVIIGLGTGSFLEESVSVVEDVDESLGLSNFFSFERFFDFLSFLFVLHEDQAYSGSSSVLLLDEDFVLR